MQPIRLLRNICLYGPGHGSSDGDQCQREQTDESQLLSHVNADIPEYGDRNDYDCSRTPSQHTNKLVRKRSYGEQLGMAEG